VVAPGLARFAAAGLGFVLARRKAWGFAAWLGLVPKQVSTGDRTLLRGSSKRGNRYLRTMFIGVARSVLLRRVTWADHAFGRWLEAPAPRLHGNVLAVALANKLARIAWSVLTREGGGLVLVEDSCVDAPATAEPPASAVAVTAR
jgi:transposase